MNKNNNWINIRYTPNIFVDNPFLFEWGLSLNNIHLNTIPIIINLKSIIEMRLRGDKLLHIHWPEYQWRSKNIYFQILKLIRFISYLLIFKILSIKIIFSVHNFAPHEKQFGSNFNLLDFIYRFGDLLVYHTYAYELIEPKKSIFTNKKILSIYHKHPSYNSIIHNSLKDINRKNKVLTIIQRQYFSISKIKKIMLNSKLVSELEIWDKSDVFFKKNDDIKVIKKGKLTHKEMVSLISSYKYILLLQKDNLTSGIANLSSALKTIVITNNKYISYDLERNNTTHYLITKNGYLEKKEFNNNISQKNDEYDHIMDYKKAIHELMN